MLHNSKIPSAAVADSDEPVIQTLLAHERCQINALDANFRSALHWAAYLGKSRLCALLLNRGARIFCQDANGGTPLHYAVRAASVDTVQTFMKRPQVSTELWASPTCCSYSLSMPPRSLIIPIFVEEPRSCGLRQTRNVQRLQLSLQLSVGQSNVPKRSQGFFVLLKCVTDVPKDMAVTWNIGIRTAGPHCTWPWPRGTTTPCRRSSQQVPM